MELKLTKAKANQLLFLLEINDREKFYYGNRDQYIKRHKELVTDLKLLLNGVSRCVCEIPEPVQKCSENGIFAYCRKCTKTL